MNLRQWTDAAGTINRRYVTFSRATGCWRWKGRIQGRCSGPTAALPQIVLRELGSDRPQQLVSVRKWVWERAGREVPAGAMVVATCGDRRCVLLEHAGLRQINRKVTDNILDDLVARRPTETTTAAARRLGVSRPTILRNLGHIAHELPHPWWTTPIVRDRPVAGRRSAWLSRHVPAECPADVRPLDWWCLERYLAGQSMRAIGHDLGVSGARVSQRISRVAHQLGWRPFGDFDGPPGVEDRGGLNDRTAA